jgi:hypothetical protein
LPEPSIQNLLVVGIDTVSIANSAKKAGYKIYAADYFGDMDLRCVCSGFKAIIKQKRGKSCGRMESKFKPEAFLKIANSISEKYKIDAILLSSGLDDDFNILYELNDLAPILGNSPRVIERVRKKPRFFKELKRLGIAHPETAIVKDIDEAKSSAARIGYPVVVKPVRGFGGDSIRTARNFKELERAFKISFVSEEILVQKFINGLHASISLLATTKDVKTLTINEQLLGLHFLFQQEPFGYCGNIVPLYVADSIFKRCKHITEKIASHFGLQGSNGIDLVISKEGTPYVVEVNPRLQGTLECVERVIGINLVKSHVNACLHGSLPTIKERTSTFCTRLILYSPKRIIAPDLVAFREVRDVPLPECIIEKGEPICSIITEGKNRNFSFQKARKLAKSIYNMVHSA